MTKTEEYFQYINEHRQNVSNAWNKTKPFIDKQKYNSITMEKLIASHDLSKYSVEEFTPYRQNFFPYEGEVCDKLKFEEAWQHHKDNNPPPLGQYVCHKLSKSQHLRTYTGDDM